MFDKIDAVIFDLDGTLVDSMWMWGSIDDEYLGAHGIKVPEDLSPLIEGMSFSDTAQYFKERFALTDSIDQIKQDWNQMAMDKYRHEVPLKSGALRLLQWLKDQGILVGIASSNSRQLIDEVLRALHIEQYFDCVCTSCEVASGKPAPDVYLLAAERLQVEPSRCLVFEDIVMGIQAGKNAGMKVCAVADDYSKDTWEQKIKEADYFVEDLMDCRLEAHREKE